MLNFLRKKDSPVKETQQMLNRLLLLSALSSALWSASAQPQPSSDDSRDYRIAAEGSTTTHRVTIDGASGQVVIYGGGAIPIGTHLVSFHFLFDQTEVGNTFGYITPLLFEQISAGIYTVIGIGKGYEVQQELNPQSIPFTIIDGVKIPTNARCTFGYVNALVDANGVPTLTSPGTVDFDYSVDPGQGIGGPATSNDWGVTNYATVVVTLGTTFGAAAANYPFIQLRTYSAFMDGVYGLATSIFDPTTTRPARVQPYWRLTSKA